jgi:hypothetical protein
MVIIDDQSPSPLDQCGQLHQILNEELKKESPTGFLIVENKTLPLHKEEQMMRLSILTSLMIHWLDLYMFLQ